MKNQKNRTMELISKSQESEAFNSQRLSFARRRRGLTKKRLSELLGVSLRMVSAYESGEKGPSAETLDQIVTHLDFPRAFFYGDDLDEVRKENVSFRSLSKMTSAQRDSALSSASLALTLNRWIEQRFRLPSPSVPDWGEVFDPTTAAKSLRGEWGLGKRPIKNLIHLLESKGVRVFSLVEECAEVDAFSFWEGRTPFIFLNTVKSAERSRFDAAHELGHLVMHQHKPSAGRESENQANQFASVLLMPKQSILAKASRRPSMETVLREKRIWGVSAFAFVRRLKDVGLLTDWSYRDLCIRMAQRGYRKQEPNSRPRETSQVLQKVLGQLKGEGVSKNALAESLNISPAELNKLIFGLAMIDIEGGQATSPARGQLKLIK